jgi:hypothetical protein
MRHPGAACQRHGAAVVVTTDAMIRSRRSQAGESEININVKLKIAKAD